MCGGSFFDYFLASLVFHIYFHGNVLWDVFIHELDFSQCENIGIISKAKQLKRAPPSYSPPPPLCRPHNVASTLRTLLYTPPYLLPFVQLTPSDDIFPQGQRRVAVRSVASVCSRGVTSAV